MKQKNDKAFPLEHQMTVKRRRAAGVKKYLSFFRLRFMTGLQYRVAALAGLATQFAWGGLLLLAYRAFYRSDPNAFPMTFQATATYIWLQQAFLALFQPWGFENDIFESVRTGGVAYELCRPVSVYNMWFSRTVARRVSQAALRCFPVLILAAFLPAPYGVALPSDIIQLLWALLSAVLGTLVAAALCQIVYFTAFFTVAVEGVRAISATLSEFLCGQVIPLPFLPDGFRQVVELLPFASTMNAPLRIYAGDITGVYLYQTVALQVFWLFALVLLGKLMERAAMKRTVLLGG